jgi:hypothetical protein
MWPASAHATGKSAGHDRELLDDVVDQRFGSGRGPASAMGLETLAKFGERRRATLALRT